MVAEDDIDMESLQAQIDMSMSFAHNLVTSWIKPTHFAQLRSSGANATQILEEELRRPPRLGVGASIPAAPPLAHEASKLKRRLGKHGAKNEGVMESQPQDSSKLDGEEHKGRPAKRKTKADPFGHEGSKKKRKAESKANLDASLEDVPKHSVSLLRNATLRELAKHNPSSWNEKQRMGPGDQRRPTTSVSQPPMRLPVQTTFSTGLTVPAPAAPPLSEPSQVASGALRTMYLLSAHLLILLWILQTPVPGKSTTPESSRVHINVTSIPNKAEPLGIPLLNLDGPPELTGKPGNTNELNNSTKKRKRRKKKKKQMVAGTGDN